MCFVISYHKDDTIQAYIITITYWVYQICDRILMLKLSHCYLRAQLNLESLCVCSKNNGVITACYFFYVLIDMHVCLFALNKVLENKRFKHIRYIDFARKKMYSTCYIHRQYVLIFINIIDSILQCQSMLAGFICILPYNRKIALLELPYNKVMSRFFQPMC